MHIKLELHPSHQLALAYTLGRTGMKTSQRMDSLVLILIYP